LPLSVLKEGAGGFLQWLFQVTNPMPQAERISMQDALNKINKQWIKTIDDYHSRLLPCRTRPNRMHSVRSLKL